MEEASRLSHPRAAVRVLLSVIVAVAAMALISPIPHQVRAASVSGGVVLDGYGGIHPFGGATVNTANAPYWPGWDISRALVVLPGGTGGWELDGWGGIHNFGAAPPIASPVYWPGWDIARDFVVYPSGSGYAGYLLDGYGGLHPFGGAPYLPDSTYWPGWDIARSLSLNFNSQGVPTGGWILDAWGGIHAFGSAPPLPGYTAYTPGSNTWYKLRVSADGGYAITRTGGIMYGGNQLPFDTSGMPSWGSWGIVSDIVALGLPDAQYGISAPLNSNFSYDAQASSMMDQMMSQDRESRGLPGLAENPLLDQIAGGTATYNLGGCGGPSDVIESRADDMYARQYFNHPIPGCSTTQYVFDTYYTSYGISWQTAGENIEWSEGQTTLSSSASEANTLWLNSPEHYANIMDSAYNQIGCGVSYVSQGSYQGASGPISIWVCDFAG